jgi:hypothetical protein
MDALELTRSAADGNVTDATVFAESIATSARRSAPAGFDTNPRSTADARDTLNLQRGPGQR